MPWNSATRYQLLLKINNAIVREKNRDCLFKALADEIRKIFAYDRFSINLYIEESETLSYFATAEGVVAEGIELQERPVERGAIANAVIHSRQPLIVADLSTYNYWESVRSMIKAGLKTTMAFPLAIRGKVIGTMHFSFKNIPADMDSLVDFLTDLADQVAIAVDNMLAYTRLKLVTENLKQQNEFLMAEDDKVLSIDNFYFASPRMNAIMRQAKMIAETDASVLISGETGTGKDQVARFIHNMSNRCEALFVKVNCPALTMTLFESELFGHTKGAFTGAERQRVGRFELAEGGTIFLDEIGELPLSLQAKLLHVLQDKTFERVGDSRSLAVDFRVIAATNQDLEAAIRAGTFRSDLYYRINTVSVSLPPLRERPEDVPLLVERLSEMQAKSSHQLVPRFTMSALEEMLRYRWPGNVRELKNLIKRLFILRPGEMITDLDIKSMLDIAGNHKAVRIMTLADAEKLHIERTLALTRGQIAGEAGAAAVLGVPRTTLQYRLRKLGIDPEVFKNAQ